jgi:hypothetical protein
MKILIIWLALNVFFLAWKYLIYYWNGHKVKWQVPERSMEPDIVYPRGLPGDR